MGEIVDGCKALSFRLARRRAFDPGAADRALAGAWERAIDGLVRDGRLTADRRGDGAAASAAERLGAGAQRARACRRSRGSSRLRVAPGARCRARWPRRSMAAEARRRRDLDAEDWWFRGRLRRRAARPPARRWSWHSTGSRRSPRSTSTARACSTASRCSPRTRSTSDALLQAHNELAICCRALAPRLPERPTAARPVADAARRRRQPALLPDDAAGPGPGFAPGPGCRGPWRPVSARAPSRLRARRRAGAARAVDDDGTGCGSAPCCGRWPERWPASVLPASSST